MQISVPISKSDVSIHPPRVGRDQRRLLKLSLWTSFNPPSPCGEGHQCLDLFFWQKGFQSTLPVWGGTSGGALESGHCGGFNPPSPCGEGHPCRRGWRAGHEFQSTLPVWGGTAKVHKNSFRFHALSTNSLAFFVITSCFPGENQKTGGKFVKISVRRSQGNPGRFPLAPVYTIRVPPGS